MDTHKHKHTCLQMSWTKAISRNQMHASSWCTPGLKGLYGSPNCIKPLPNLSSIAYTSVAHSCLCSDACSWLELCYITGVCVVSNTCNYGTWPNRKSPGSFRSLGRQGMCACHMSCIYHSRHLYNVSIMNILDTYSVSIVNILDRCYSIMGWAWGYTVSVDCTTWTTSVQCAQ